MNHKPISRALIVKDPYATQIVRGDKDKEYRTRRTNIRGRVGIIKAGTKRIIGEVDIIACIFDNLSPNLYRDNYIWCLSNPGEYKKPKPYHHPRGAQIWVCI